MTQHLSGILPYSGAANSVKEVEKDSEEEEGNQRQCWKAEGEEGAKVGKRELASAKRVKVSF